MSKQPQIMQTKKSFATLGIAVMLTANSTSSFASRFWTGVWLNGRLVSFVCYDSGGTCLPEAIVNQSKYDQILNPRITVAQQPFGDPFNASPKSISPIV